MISFRHIFWPSILFLLWSAPASAQYVTIQGCPNGTNVINVPGHEGRAAVDQFGDICLGTNITLSPTVQAAQSGIWNVGLTGSLPAFATPPALGASTAKIGIVTTDQTTPGTTDLVHAAQQGAWNVGQQGTWNVGQQGTWNVGLTGTLPAFASPPTVVLGAGSAKVGIFTTDQTTPGTTDLVHITPSGVFQAAGLDASSTNASSTISVTNTFQSVLASNGSRRGCLLQNNGQHVMYVFVGANGSATLTNSFQLLPGWMFNCASPGVVATDNISLTGTSSDAFALSSQ